MFTKSCGMVVAGARCLSGVECGSVVVRLVRVRRQRFIYQDIVEWVCRGPLEQLPAERGIAYQALRLRHDWPPSKP